MNFWGTGRLFDADLGKCSEGEWSELLETQEKLKQNMNNLLLVSKILLLHTQNEN